VNAGSQLFNNGHIDSADDLDFYAASLQAGQTYKFNVQVNPTDPAFIHNATLTLYNHDGKEIKSDLDGSDATIDYTAAGNETHYLAVGAVGAETGDYKLIA